MKKIFQLTLLLFITLFAFQSCQDMDDVAAPMNLEVKDFIWKGLNQYYLWQADVPNLADDRFATQAELNTFLSGYSTPESLFDALRVDKSIDRFSWIVSDYLELEGALQGTTKMTESITVYATNQEALLKYLVGYDILFLTRTHLLKTSSVVPSFTA